MIANVMSTETENITSSYQICLLNMETMERQYGSFVQRLAYGGDKDLDAWRKLSEYIELKNMKRPKLKWLNVSQN